MNRTASIAILGVVALLQLAAPGYMVFSQERVLRTGVSYRFKTAPVDPYDVFRGRYVALSFEINSAPMDAPSSFIRGQKVYVAIEEDQDGFAKAASVGESAPDAGDYIKVKVGYVDSSSKEVYFQWPFQRYYMEEDLALDAETAYRSMNRSGGENTYVTVRVKKGRAVIEELYLDDKPVREYLSTQSTGE